MATGETLDNLKNNAAGFINKGKDWLQNEISQVEGWARDNSEDAKQKLLAKAREHGVDVNDKMEIGEIKNKIKTKLRDKFGNQG